MRQRFEAIFITNLRNSGIRVTKFVNNALFTFLHHPFINRFMEHRIEDAPEGNSGVSA